MRDQNFDRMVDRIVAKNRRGMSVRELVERARDRWLGTPEKRVWWRKWSIRVGPALLVVLVVGLWWVFGPYWQPNYKKDRLSRVFNYTLLTDEFNRLPVEKRLELLGQLVQRLRGMSAGDSAMMAAFAAGIAGSAREQLETNASKLAIDLWDKYAKDYDDVKAEDQDAWLDASFIEFTKTMELLSGKPREVSDAERLAEGRRQAQRDMERMRERPPTAQQLGNMMYFMRYTVGDHATPQQRTRGALLIRDMTRRMRGGSTGDGGGR